MVKTERIPEDILNENTNFIDREAIVKFLSDYQKSRPDWEIFRRKIPEGLLLKWEIVLRECRKIGYVAPKIKNGELVFKQILTRTPKNIDDCSLCSKSITAGTCLSRGIIKKQQLMFKPCWS
jgi:hypothetical protein